MVGLPRDLERDVATAVRKGEFTKTPTDGSRGAHEVRQIGVHRAQGAQLGYSEAFKTNIAKWTGLMYGIGFGRARGHVSR